MAIDDLRVKFFPQLSHNAEEISLEDDVYNCIAWAAGADDIRWWPVDVPTTGVFWPIDPPQDTVDGFVAAFQALGYEPCNDGSLETGFEKVALYVDAQGAPSHMARQLSSGHWTSKLGLLQDIRHPAPEELCGTGNAYGQIDCFMKRQRVDVEATENNQQD